MNAPRKGTGGALGWVAILYLAQGLPFGVFTECVPVYLRVHGAGLQEIGLLTLLGLPWTLKVLWAPLVDRFGKPQAWISTALAAMAIALLLLGGVDAGRPTQYLIPLLALFTLASATQDIAIDAYTIGLLKPRQVGTANGIRVTSYRIALILGGGGIVALAETRPWSSLFALTAALLALIAGAVLLSTPIARDERERRRIFPPLLAWVRRPATGWVFLFILVYKLGDAAMAPMVKPFWVDRGMSLLEIGMISTTLGVGATIAGALLGGWFTSRRGILAGLIILGLAQAASNLVYAGVAATSSAAAAIYAASLVESFTAGLGTAAFLAFLMSICQKEHAATQYALLTALFGLGRSIAGAASGWGVERLGYAPYFAFTFLLALPAFALLPAVARYLRASSDGRAIVES
ncbi:MAG: AmpG family muropeptide MFS transporter [Candidatus Eisenbacteria bacterium]|nr:AmpG family muropeptide MFS transporter [Candidatus Eisenbacteria bacterium]